MSNSQPDPATAAATETWAERAAERSPSVQQSRTRSLARARQIVQAARRLVTDKGTAFTTQDLVREAGVALKTFYKHFGSKDQVLLAVLEDMIAEGCAAFVAAAAEMSDPLERLRFYVTAVIAGLDADPGDAIGPRFITSEHWRLQQLYPEEVALASRPFTELLVPEIRAATAAGLLHPNDVEYDAWLVNQLAMAVYHHYAFSNTTEPHEQVADRLWSFCLAALGGQPDSQSPNKKSKER